MAGTRVKGLNHASVTVCDLDQMIAFFVDGLGYRLVSRGPRDPKLIERMTGIPGASLEIAFVEAAGHRVELIRYMAPEGRQTVKPRLCDVGAAHIGLDIADLDGALAAAGRYGFALAGEVIRIDAGPNSGRRVCYLRNGDGITVEFLEVRSSA